MPRVAVLGDASVGKASLARALGASRSHLQPRLSARSAVERLAWAPGGRRAAGASRVALGVYRGEKQRRQALEDAAAPGDALLLVFDLTRRCTLDAVVAQVGIRYGGEAVVCSN